MVAPSPGMGARPRQVRALCAGLSVEDMQDLLTYPMRMTPRIRPPDRHGQHYLKGLPTRASRAVVSQCARTREYATCSGTQMRIQIHGLFTKVRDAEPVYADDAYSDPRTEAGDCSANRWMLSLPHLSAILIASLPNTASAMCATIASLLCRYPCSADLPTLLPQRMRPMFSHSKR